MIQNLFTFAIVCIVVGGAIYLHQHHHFIFHRPDARALNNTHKALTQHGKKPVKADPTFKWPVLWVALVLLAAAAVPIAREARRRKAGKAARDWEPPTLADELSDEISLALDDLRSERDIRRPAEQDQAVGALVLDLEQLGAHVFVRWRVRGDGNGRHVELGQDTADVALDRFFADVQVARDPQVKAVYLGEATDA